SPACAPRCTRRRSARRALTHGGTPTHGYTHTIARREPAAHGTRITAATPAPGALECRCGGDFDTSEERVRRGRERRPVRRCRTGQEHQEADQPGHHAHHDPGGRGPTTVGHSPQHHALALPRATTGG